MQTLMSQSDASFIYFCHNIADTNFPVIKLEQQYALKKGLKLLKRSLIAWVSTTWNLKTAKSTARMY